jgi:hypothetical protein
VGTIVDGFQDHADDLLHHLVPDARDTKLPHLPVRLRNEGRSHGFEAEAFGSHQLDDVLDFFKREAVQRLSICSRRHVSRFGLDPFVGDDVEVFLEHQPVQSVVDPLLVAIQFAQGFQSF